MVAAAEKGRAGGRGPLAGGGAGAIGLGIAEGPAGAGRALPLVARPLGADPGAGLEGTSAEHFAAIARAGGRAVPIVADLASPADRARIVPEARAALGPIDVLVHNAAAAIYAPVAEIPLKRRQITFEVNVHATLDLAQAVLPEMRARKQGWIVNLSSASSMHPKGPPFGGGESTTITVYGASKAALERITTGLAAEVHADGVAVNSIAPVAAVRTPGAEALVGELMKTHPELVEPVEWLAEAVLALATCDPRTCTGRILYSGPFLDEIGRKPAVTA